MDKDMQDVLKKAEVLIEALPYIQKFNRKIIVVKYGGSAMSNEELQKNVIKDVTLLKLVGFNSRINKLSPCKPERLSSHAVTVVPTLEPKITPTAWCSCIMPEFTKPTTITVVALEL